MSEMEKRKVLFICTHNSARSQMAEALLNGMMNDRYEAFSAGTYPTSVHPGTIAALKEIGFGTTGLYSKPISGFLGSRFDLVVTVCDRAKETCSFFPGATRTIHSGFSDPEDLVREGMDEADAFRSVRDSIRSWIEENL